MVDYNINTKGTVSERFLDHANNPRNMGDIINPDGYAENSGECNDTMAISLEIRDGKIVEVKFWTNGCGATIACGSVVTELAKDNKISEAVNIGASEIILTLEDIPPENVHCAFLAADTLQKAIKDYCAKNDKNPKSHKGPMD